MVKDNMSPDDLLKSFKAITDNIKKTDRSVAPVNKTSKKTDAVAPSPSSQPTGSKWSIDALSKNIRSAFNINPTTTGAIKDILGLPIKHQITLLNAISER